MGTLLFPFFSLFIFFNGLHDFCHFFFCFCKLSFFSFNKFFRSLSNKSLITKPEMKDSEKEKAVGKD